MKGIIYFGAIAVIFALALGDVFATKPSDEYQNNGLVQAGDDTDIKRIVLENEESIERAACKDKISSKKCKKLKKKKKCKDKATWKKCMFTCKKCPDECDPATTCSGHGTCAEDGSCNCDVGFFGDSCMFPEICDDEPGLLRDGDKIHLLNQYSDQDDGKSYLDTCGEYTFEGCNGTYNVQTTASPNRDFGSGTWEIRSVNGTGGPIRYGDKIHLLNQYGTKSYLDTCGDETKGGCKGKYNLQTTLSPNRDSGSGTWEISSEKCIGGPVRNGDKIHLINQYKKKSYLDTCSKYSIDPSNVPCNGTFHVQTSKNPNRDAGSGTWEIDIIFQGNEDFARFDKDADELISLSEWIETCTYAMNITMVNSMVGREMNETTYNEIFNETDCNDDGNITPKELKMATEQLGGCCDGICCPWCGIVIKTIVSSLQAPAPFDGDVYLDNKSTYQVTGTVIYSVCSDDDYSIAPGDTFKHYRGGCLITKITGYYPYVLSGKPYTFPCTFYHSAGTTYNFFKIVQLAGQGCAITSL